MHPTTAIAELQPDTWAQTDAATKLALLKEVRTNLRQHAEALGAADARMKTEQLGAPLINQAESTLSVVLPVGGLLNALIKLYEELVAGRVPSAIATQPHEAYTDVTVYPYTWKDRVFAPDQRGFLRVRGAAEQQNPLDAPGGIIGILGAGNYSSSVELFLALFIENCAVVHKPHELNAETDQIWEQVTEPLVRYGALRFCAATAGPELTTDPRLTRLYFTGSTATAQKIRESTNTPLVAECGGNNPIIIVPGTRPWSQAELRHQALVIAALSKLNGGAVCGRGQTIVTSRQWEQREAFLDTLRWALTEGTPAAGSYYPGSQETHAEFAAAHPSAERLTPDSTAAAAATSLLITDADPASFAVSHEAFCQVMSEVPLDVPATAAAFLPAATQFCNEQLLGTLAAMVIIDERTRRSNQAAVAQAITDLRYGAIGINTTPPTIWLNPYLTWGGNEDRPGQPFVSGIGNFGNVLNYQNVEKSVLESRFRSPGHILMHNQAHHTTLYHKLTSYTLTPSWGNLLSLAWTGLRGQWVSRDW